jgi:hypothetical protein
MITYKIINCMNVMPMPKKQGFQIMQFYLFFKNLVCSPMVPNSS